MQQIIMHVRAMHAAAWIADHFSRTMRTPWFSLSPMKDVAALAKADAVRPVEVGRDGLTAVAVVTAVLGSGAGHGGDRASLPWDSKEYRPQSSGEPLRQAGRHQDHDDSPGYSAPDGQLP